MGLLEALERREGHCDVPTGHVEGSGRLEIWLWHQRIRYKARSLSSEDECKAMGVSALSDKEVQRLEALGVKWGVLRKTEFLR